MCQLFGCGKESCSCKEETCSICGASSKDEELFGSPEEPGYLLCQHCITYPPTGDE